MRRRILFILIAAALFPNKESLAQTDLRASQIGNGGGLLAGLNYQIVGTLGQSVAGFSEQLRSGFWYVAGPAATAMGVEDDLSGRDEGAGSLPGSFGCARITSTRSIRRQQ